MIAPNLIKVIISKTLILLSLLVFAQTSHAQQSPHIEGNSSLIQQDVGFWIVNSEVVQHNPILLPQLSQFGNQIFKQCKGVGINEDVIVSVTLKLTTSLDNEIKKIFKQIQAAHSTNNNPSDKYITPREFHDLRINIGDSIYAIEDSKKEGEYSVLFEDYCDSLKNIYYSLADKNANFEKFIKISGIDSNSQKEAALIYPVEALQKGLAGNIHAYRPNGDNSKALSCRLGQQNKKYTSPSYQNITGKKSSNCGMTYKHNFKPSPGHIFISKPVVLTYEVQSNSRSSGRRSNKLTPNPIAGTAFFSSVTANGHVNNKRKGKRERCGIYSLKISAMQMPKWCVQYLD